MQNGKVGEGDVFSKENILIALFAYKISKQFNTNYIDKCKNLK
jgi:hypothetical protein